MSDLAFEQLLAQHNAEYKEAEEFGGNWMPDVGKGYVVLLTKNKTGQSTKDGRTDIWWRITGRIENVADSEQHGKDFCVGWFRTSTKGLGFTKAAARILNNGVVVDDLVVVNQLFENSPGTLVYVDVQSSRGKDGNTYINAYMTGLIAAEEVMDELVGPPQTAEEVEDAGVQ